MAEKFTMRNTANASVGSILLPNGWDILVFPIIIGILALMAIGFQETTAPIAVLKEQPISLDPSHLPNYALRTILRMLAAMVASLIFTFTYATLAAKSRRAEKLLIPMLDILQSVPVLGFISFTVTFFLGLFPSSVLGAELASVFAIFTSQAWNMAFSFYQSLRTLPSDLQEVSRGFHLTGWQKFWKLEVPFAMPGLIWNMMMSMSGAWFFVVASEAITVGDKTVRLPGIGSYLALAIERENITAIVWVILTMVIVILAYDQLLGRPLVAWSDKFRMENTSSGHTPESFVLNLFMRTRMLRKVFLPIGYFLGWVARWRLSPSRKTNMIISNGHRKTSKLIDILWIVLLVCLAVYFSWSIYQYISAKVTLKEVIDVFYLGLITLVRVSVLMMLASLVWVPVGVMIGLRPRLAEKVQPFAQFLAAFPANLLFPIAVLAIVHWHLNPDIWLSPLIVLGSQWYILFNVIAGTTAYPNDFREVAQNFRIRGWQWWFKCMLPGIFPYYVTGAITASGGAWNASIVSEYVQWGATKVQAHGLGGYIAQYTASGDFPRIILGVTVMSLFVTLFNRLVWRRLYRFAETRLRLN